MERLRDATGVWLAVVAPEHEEALMEWAAHRSVAGHPHLAPLDGIARLEDGRLAVRFVPLAGLPLPAALDRIGSLTPGVAVTLSLPLLDVGCVLAHGGARVGGVRPDRVVVDDSGAPVVVDRPPGTLLPRPEARSRPGRVRRVSDPASDQDGGVTGTVHDSHDRVPWGDPLEGILLAVRVIWDRVDGRDPHRETVEAAIVRARHNPVDEIAILMDTVRAAGPPRPVRWNPTAAVGHDGYERDSMQNERTLVRILRGIVEEGIPIGRGSRIALRRAFIGAIVAAGLVVASLLVLGAH